MPNEKSVFLSNFFFSCSGRGEGSAKGQKRVCVIEGLEEEKKRTVVQACTKNLPTGLRLYMV